MLRCSRCSCWKDVPKDWDRKLCPECTQKQYERRAKQREQRKIDREKQLEQQKQRILESSVSPELDDIPVESEECLVFRDMCLGKRAKDKWFFRDAPSTLPLVCSILGFTQARFAAWVQPVAIR